MLELLSKVSIDLVSVRETVRGGLDNEDKKPIGAASHVLISVAGAIGAVSTQNAAQSLNKACHRDDWSEIIKFSDECLTNIEELLNFTENKVQ